MNSWYEGFVWRVGMGSWRFDIENWRVGMGSWYGELVWRVVKKSCYGKCLRVGMANWHGKLVWRVGMESWYGELV